MTERDLGAAWNALQRSAMTLPEREADASAWWRCVTELLWGDAVPDVELARNLKLGPLATAAQCAASPTAAMLEALRDVPRGPQKASVLTRLAQWWLSEFGENDSPEWRADLEHYRMALRAIRGIGPETADRLLLFAAELPVFPVDRAILRIAVRHGWLDWPVDDEAAQATFLGNFRGDVTVMQVAARQLKSLGAEFCGRTPICEKCALAPFLPEPGPLHIDQC